MGCGYRGSENITLVLKLVWNFNPQIGIACFCSRNTLLVPKIDFVFKLSFDIPHRVLESKWQLQQSELSSLSSILESEIDPPVKSKLYLKQHVSTIWKLIAQKNKSRRVLFVYKYVPHHQINYYCMGYTTSIAQLLDEEKNLSHLCDLVFHFMTSVVRLVLCLNLGVICVLISLFLSSFNFSY